MRIEDHPDFKVTKSVQYCPECERETEFSSGLVLNGDEDRPQEYEQCHECGFDYVTDGIV